MDTQNSSYPHSDGVNVNYNASGNRGQVSASRNGKELKKKNLKKMAKKNGIREKIIVDIIDDDISKVEHISDKEMRDYNKDYQEFLKKAHTADPIDPLNNVMVANIQDYLKFSEDGAPAMVYYSNNLKIPLLTLKKGSEVKPHSDITGIYSVLEGKGTIQVGMKDYKISKGSLIHVPKGVIRAISCEEDLKIMAIHVS